MGAEPLMALSIAGAQHSEPDLASRLKVLERRCQREKAARQQVETFLEQKSLELYEANEQLKKVNEGLEKTVSEKTHDLRTALRNIQEAKKRTEHLALHDPLTSLPNRRFLRTHLDEVFARGRADGSSVAVLHIDLDRFKLINDTLGHAAGDHVLSTVAEILNEVSGEGDFIARVGGDEFVIVTQFESDPAHVKQLAAEIPLRVAKPIAFKERQLRIGASVGYSYDRADRTAPDKLLISSDIALYEAKDHGRGVAQEFTSELEVVMNQKKVLADEIHDALERQEFIPYYQPKICAQTFRIVGVEALVRWQHPKRGLMFPDSFLDVASDMGVLAQIDDIMLRCAAAHFREWQDMGLEIPQFSVNMSLGRLLEPDLMERLDRLDLPKGQVGFEVVESIFFDNPDSNTLDRINAIKQRGIEIEIDDFGTGHASIIGVVKLEPSKLKIDRQLIQDLGTNPVQERVVKAIVEIGKSLDLMVIAEGVETQEQVSICARMGCDILQGYFFSKPLSKAALESFARDFDYRPTG